MMGRKEKLRVVTTGATERRNMAITREEFGYAYGSVWGLPGGQIELVMSGLVVPGKTRYLDAARIKSLGDRAFVYTSLDGKRASVISLAEVKVARPTLTPGSPVKITCFRHGCAGVYIEGANLTLGQRCPLSFFDEKLRHLGRFTWGDHETAEGFELTKPFSCPNRKCRARLHKVVVIFNKFGGRPTIIGY